MYGSVIENRGGRDDRGAAALMVALTTVALLVAGALVVDLGLVRVDRQVDRSAADSATLAGLNGMRTGGGKALPFAGVCTALRYLRSSDPRFSGVTSTSGTWTDGSGAGTANGCTDPILPTKPCIPGNPASWARYTWSGTFQGAPIVVTIQSGYQLTSSTGWAEDDLPAATTDRNDSAQGCDQLAVTVQQSRHPGLGSVIRPSNLITSVRSVGRVKLGPGGYAPAMLLLKRTGCTSLAVGSTASGSWVKVYGAITSSGVSQPGTIHADADGLNCGSDVFYGKANDGIIAYAAPLPAPGGPDPTKPGQITSVAGLSGLGTAYDGIGHVYGSKLLTGSGGAVAPTGRSLVTRMPVDDRYLAGVRQAVSGATTGIFASGINASNATLSPYNFTASVTCPSSGPNKGMITALPPLTQASSLFVDCATVLGSISIPAGTVVFNGTIAPSNGNTVPMPNAKHVYVFGTPTGHAIDLTSSGATLKVNTNVNTLNGANCTPSVTPAGSKAILFVKSGDFNESNGGKLQMCNTTVIMMGGRSDACLPAAYTDITNAPAPNPTACPGVNSDLGNGQVKQTGGDIDWTAPNEIDATVDANGDPLPAALTGWADPNGPEDLALWDESTGTTNASNAYTLTGGGTFRLQGIFMTPNAEPVSLSGSANLSLLNAQFVASSLQLASNNTTLSMTVDPNSAVTLPKLKTVGLVR